MSLFQNNDVVIYKFYDAKRLEAFLKNKWTEYVYISVNHGHKNIAIPLVKYNDANFSIMVNNYGSQHSTYYCFIFNKKRVSHNIVDNNQQLASTTLNENIKYYDNYVFTSKDIAEYKRVFDLDISHYSHINYCVFSTVRSLQDQPLYSPSEYEVRVIAQSIYAPRREAFTKSSHGIKIVSLDCNYSYATAMIGNLFPVGNPIKTDVYVPGKLGIYHCSINIPYNKRNSYYVIPDKRGYYSHINGCYNSVDIEYAIKNNYTVKVYYGFYWERSACIFDEYFAKLAAGNFYQSTKKFLSFIPAVLTTVQYTPDTYTPIKDFDFKNGDMRGISIEDNNIVSIKNRLNVTLNLSYITSFVFAYQRRFMHEVMLRTPNVLAVFVDCIYIPLAELHLFNDLICYDDDKKEIGMFKIEKMGSHFSYLNKSAKLF